MSKTRQRIGEEFERIQNMAIRQSQSPTPRPSKRWGGRREIGEHVRSPPTRIVQVGAEKHCTYTGTDETRDSPEKHKNETTMNNRSVWISLVLVITIAFPLFAGETKTPKETKRRAKKSEVERPAFEGAERELYKTVGDVKLYLHIITPEGFSVSDKRPAIVFFFGGGWNGGSPTQFGQHCRYLASRGMVAISADYRVKSRNGTTPRECVQDGRSAVRWIRANAARLGIDPERIAAGGGSAGGHVAAATGTLDGLDEPGEDTSVSAKPNALVLFNPVYDNGPDGYGYERVKDYYKEISPLDNIKPGVPPTIVFLGTEDKLIPVSTANKYEAKMKAAGNRCETHLYEGEGHGFFNYGRGDAQLYRDTVEKMDRFLASLGYLEGEPTIGTE